MRYLILVFFTLSVLSGSLAYASLSPLDASPNIPSLCKISNTTHVLSCAGIEDTFNMTGSNGIKIKLDNTTHTITVVGVTQNTNHGTYNQTYANNILVNSGGHRLNFLNGTNSTINLVNDPTRNQINITVSSTGGGGGGSGVSSLNALSGALTIACVAGNTTCTTSGGNTITINTAYNIATLNLNEIFSGITTMNNLKLGGQMNINNKSFQSLGHVYTWPNNTGTICLTNQTGSCGPAGSATYDTIQNIGTGEASVYAGNTTKTNFQFKTLKQGSHITLTNNTNDVTIGTSGLLSSALLSLNGDTTAAQVVASANTNHITVTNAGANHNIDTAFKVNNATCSAGNAVTSYNNVTGVYGCSPFGSLSNAITSVNSQTGPSINIVCQTGNTTCTNSTNQIKIGFGVNPVITGGSAQTISKGITHTSDVTMKGSAISFDNNLLTAGMNINSSLDNFGSATLLMHPSGSLPARWTILPGGAATSNIVTLNRVSSLVNYETLIFGSDVIGANEFSIASYNGGTGTLRPINFYMLNTKLFSMDTGNTITSYVKNIWTPIADATGANGIWKSSTNADVLKYRNNADSSTYNILSTLGAVTTSTPVDPTGTTSTTAKMMGLAGAITPAVSTRIDVTICGQMANSLINDGVTVQLRYGTGTAPTNGATLTGTQLGASQTNTEKVAAQNDGFCVTGIATGLTIGTAYWLDTAVNAVTAGTASITGITIKAHEI